MIGFGGKSIRKLMATLRRNQLGNQQGIQKGGQKPVDNSHSHSKQQSQNGAAGALGSAFGGAVPQEPNIMNNKFASQGAQQLGTNLWQGEQLASQTAQQRSTPTPIPGEEYLSGGRPDQDISPLMQAPYPHNDPKGSDASFGIKGYVTNQEEYTQAKQEQNNPYIYKAKDDLADKNMKQYNEAKNKKEKRKASMDSERRGDEAINI